MFKLTDVYGTNYKSNEIKDNIITTLNTIANNISHRKYEFMYNNSIIWNDQNNIINEYLIQLFQKITDVNKYLNIVQILDNRLLHTLITGVDGVNYFLIVDNEYDKSTIIYITKTSVGIL
jgi:hypothetical protein